MFDEDPRDAYPNYPCPECNGMQLFKSGAIKPEVKQRRGYEVVQLVWDR
jgi:hypothetical protein